jgi:integrase
MPPSSSSTGGERGTREATSASPARRRRVRHGLRALAKTFRLALRHAEIEDRVRPFHDLRHTSITNAAAAGTSPTALMAPAGHSDFKTTQAYIDLAGERFRNEPERLERRLWARIGTNFQYQIENPSPNQQDGPVARSRNP